MTRPSTERLTRTETLALFVAQNGLCAEPRCRMQLRPGEYDADHSQPVAFAPGTKPDQLLCKRCHKKKTHEEDRPRICKADRQAGKKGQYARRKKRGYSLLKGPGFPSPEYRRRVLAQYKEKTT